MKELNEKEALNKAAAYCSAAEHCKSEVLDKLKGWGVGDDIAEKTVETLVREKFISDDRFARAYVRDKLRFAGWGRQKSAMMLRAKNIAPEIISDAISGIDENEYMEMLFKILKSKERTLKYSNDYERRGKLMRFAASRGFESRAVSVYFESSGKDDGFDCDRDFDIYD